MINNEWNRFLHYMEYEVRKQCRPQRDALRGGPFAWLQTLSGKVFGEKVGPLIVRFFLGHEYRPRINSDHDFVFLGRTFELKTGTEHSSPGVFLFEQIRPQQKWDVLCCVGISRNALEFFVIPRAVIVQGVAQWRRKGNSFIMPQYGGAARRDRTGSEPDTFWIWTKPEWRGFLASFQSKFGQNGWSGQSLGKLLGDAGTTKRRKKL